MGAVVIVGRSCSGKSSVQRELCKRSRYSRCVTCTTRPPRAGEVNGVHYNFLSRDDFLSKIGLDEFAEYTEYAGNLYGTLRKDLEGDDLKVLVLEPVGAFTVKKSMEDNALIVYIMVDSETCYESLRSRGDSEDSIRERMKEDDELFDNMPEFADFCIDNEGYKMPVKEVSDAIHRAAHLFF